MDCKGVEKLRREVAALRRSQPKAKELEALAKKLGRRSVNRGKEPTFVSDEFPHLRPLAIPSHKGRDLATGTKNAILNQLEDDLIAWDKRISEEERRNDG